MAWFTGSNLARLIWRAFVTDGDPLSGAHEPVKSEIRTWGGTVETAIETILDGDRTYYVRTDGSDSNTGLVNSAGGAFLTWQKAVDVAQTLDFRNNTVTIQAGGTGTRTFTVSSAVAAIVIGPRWCGGTLVFIGNTADPFQVTISQLGAGKGVSISGDHMPVEFHGFTFKSTSSEAFGHSGTASVLVADCNFSSHATLSGTPLLAQDNVNGFLTLGGDQTIFSGNAGHALRVDAGSCFIFSTDVFIRGALTFDSTVDLRYGAMLGNGPIWSMYDGSSSVTGRKIDIDHLSGCRCAQSALTAFPGSTIKVAPGGRFTFDGFGAISGGAAVAHGVVTYSGGVPSLQASYAIDGVIDSGVGVATLQLSFEMDNDDFTVVATPRDASTFVSCTAKTATTFAITVTNSAAAAADRDFNFAVFGDRKSTP